MAYYVTPDLGLELADPATVQAFETVNVNDNFLTLEAGIVADRVRLGALESRTLTSVADFTALAALSTAPFVAGDLVYVVEGAIYMRRFTSGGGGWTQVNRATFTTTAARDTAYAKASAAYRVTGALAVTIDTDTTWRYQGGAWVLWSRPKTAFTPAWTNLTVGTGATNAGSYWVQNGIVEGEFTVTLGSTPAVGAARMAPPVGVVDAVASNLPVGRATLIDSGTGIFRGDVLYDGVGFALFYGPAAQAFWSAIGATVPFTWVAGDRIVGQFRYSLA